MNIFLLAAAYDPDPLATAHAKCREADRQRWARRHPVVIDCEYEDLLDAPEIWYDDGTSLVRVLAKEDK